MQRFPIANASAPNQRFEQLLRNQNPAYSNAQPQHVVAQNQMLNLANANFNNNNLPAAPAQTTPPSSLPQRAPPASQSQPQQQPQPQQQQQYQPQQQPQQQQYQPQQQPQQQQYQPQQQNYTPSWSAGQSLLPQKFVPSARDTKPRMPERIYFTFKFMHDRLGTLVKAGALCMCSDAETCELALVDYIVHDVAQVMREHPKGLAYANEQYKELIQRRRPLTEREQEDFALTSKLLIEEGLIFTQNEPQLPDVVVVKDLDVDYRRDMWMGDFQGPNELDYSEQLGKAFLSPVNAPTMYHVMQKNLGDQHNERDTFSPVFTYLIDYTEQYVKESVHNPSRYDDVFQS